MKYIVYLLFIITLYIPVTAFAETVLRIGENVSVDADQVVDGDYYISAGPFGNTTMSGSVAQDMYAFGGFVATNGSIGNDLTIVSGSSEIHGSIADDVRIVSGQVTIADHIGGDLFVIAGSLKMLSSASVDGDVIFFGGSAELSGKIDGSVLGTSEKMRIDGEIGKDINIKTVSALTLGEKANVGGVVRYISTQKLVRSQTAVVTGEVIYNEDTSDILDVATRTRHALIPVFVTLFATLSLYLFFRKELQLLVDFIHTVPVKSAVIGLGVLVLGPIVSMLLMVTVLGVLVGVMSAGLVLLAYIVGYSSAGIVLGSYVSALFTKKIQISLPWILVGTLGMHLLLFIPLVGFVAVISILSITIGGLVLSIYNLFS